MHLIEIVALMTIEWFMQLLYSFNVIHDNVYFTLHNNPILQLVNTYFKLMICIYESL